MTTIPAYYPPATQRPVSYAAAAGMLDQQPRGWVLHVVVGNGSPWGTFESATPPSRRFSHLWVAKTGAVEQYTPLSRKSWAQAAGNPWWWSVETEGMPSEALTDAQLDALAAWHVWCGAVDRIAGPEDTLGGAPGQGIGTHEMGGAAWGGHACPGPIRAGQRAEILRRVAALRSGGHVAFTPTDLAPVWKVGWGDETAEGRLADAAHGTAVLPTLEELAAGQARIEAKLDQLLTPKA
jgi:hypothetical protein